MSPPPPPPVPHHPPPARKPEAPPKGMTWIERFLYSLPEYRVEMQQKHFIEIYSYNGLLTTRKVIGENNLFFVVNVC
jgi:hypothetical protein